MPNEITRLTSTELHALPRREAVFFFPVGPIEDHGPHLPVGLDLFEATECCQTAAAFLESQYPGWVGVLMPPVPLGIDSNTTRMAITVRPHVLRDWLVDACMGLIRMGFFHFVCFSGHLGPKQLTAIEEAGQLIRKRVAWKKLGYIIRGEKRFPSLISANSARTTFKEVCASPFWPDPLEHGGQRDTSVALAVAPAPVGAFYKELPDQLRAARRWKRNWLRRRRRLEGYWGSPQAAQVGIGQKAIQDQVEELVPKMRAVWEGSSSPNKVFRSWYSVLPLNKTFFKAWLLVFWICIFMIGWNFLRGAMLF